MECDIIDPLKARPFFFFLFFLHRDEKVGHSDRGTECLTNTLIYRYN